MLSAAALLVLVSSCGDSGNRGSDSKTLLVHCVGAFDPSVTATRIPGGWRTANAGVPDLARITLSGNGITTEVLLANAEWFDVNRNGFIVARQWETGAWFVGDVKIGLQPLDAATGEEQELKIDGRPLQEVCGVPSDMWLWGEWSMGAKYLAVSTESDRRVWVFDFESGRRWVIPNVGLSATFTWID